MTPVTIVLIFVIVWWLVFFMVLPFGNRPAAPSELPAGAVESAPARPRLWLKAAITTGVAAALTALIVVIVQSRFVDFLEMSEQP